jgi:hypothetical protein
LASFFSRLRSRLQFNRASWHHMSDRQLLLVHHDTVYYQQRYGALEPRDHINDILIVLSAAKAHAELITENDAHMTRWREMLRRSGKTLTMTAVRRPQ